MKITFDKKQILLALGLAVVGLVLALLIVFSQPAKPGAETSAHSHASADAHAHAPAPAAAAAPAHADAHDHDHDHGHEEEEEEEEEGGANEDEHTEKVSLTAAQVARAGISTQVAGPAHIRTMTTMTGVIRFNEDRTAHVVPRVAGVVQSVPADLGQRVRKGQVLAVIASIALAEHRSEYFTAQNALEAKKTFERESKLWEDKISAEQDYLQARQSLQVATIASRNAQQKLSALSGDRPAREPSTPTNCAPPSTA